MENLSKEKQRQLDEINRPRNEELFNNLEKQYQELAKVKAESEQIEKMAEYIYGNGITHDTAFHEDCRSIARDLYNAGYRKQSEGEWIWTESGQEDYEQYWVCSCCHEKDYFEDKFCPNCGAKMKGGN